MPQRETGGTAPTKGLGFLPAGQEPQGSSPVSSGSALANPGLARSLLDPALLWMPRPAPSDSQDSRSHVWAPAACCPPRPWRRCVICQFFLAATAEHCSCHSCQRHLPPLSSGHSRLGCLGQTRAHRLVLLKPRESVSPAPPPSPKAPRPSAPAPSSNSRANSTASSRLSDSGPPASSHEDPVVTLGGPSSGPPLIPPQSPFSPGGATPTGPGMRKGLCASHHCAVSSRGFSVDRRARAQG